MDQKLKSLCDEVDQAGSQLAHKTEGVRRRLEARELGVSRSFLEHTAPKSPAQTQPRKAPGNS